MRSSARALPLTLLALALLTLLLIAGSRPPAPQPADAPAAEFSAGRALRILEQLLAEGVPHPVGTPANFVVRDRITAVLETLGYDVAVQRTYACRERGGICAPVENIVTRLAGTTEGPAVMLTAHYDSRGAGPGAADDGAGVAAILEIARIIRAEAPFRNPVVLLFTDGEEAGLLGAEAFAREHPWADSIAVAINLEARGSAGPSIMFETSAGNHWLVSAFAKAAARPVASSLTYDVYRLLPNDTDATVHRRAGMAVLNFAFIDELVHYHTALDDIAHLDPRSLQHHGDNALGTVRRFASIPLQQGASGRGARTAADAAYTDVFGLVLVHWPAAWMLPLALACSLLLVIAIGNLVRAGSVTAGAVAWGVLAALLALAAALVVGAAAGALIRGVTGGALLAYPLPAQVALWSGAALVVLGTGTLFARRAGAHGLFTGAAVTLCLLSVPLAAVLPGAAIVLLIPQAGTVLALAGVALLRGRLRTDAAAAAAALVAGFTLLQLAHLLHSAFGLQMPFAITAAVGLAALPLLPLLDVAPGVTRPRRIVLIAAGVTFAVALTGALVAPAHSVWRPQPLNIVYVQDTGTARAYWAVQGVPRSELLPEPLRAAAPFEDASMPPLTPADGTAPVAAAAIADLQPPRLDVTAEERSAAGRLLTLRARSPRGGNRMVLQLSAAARVRVEGNPVRGLRAAAADRVLYVLHGLRAAGTEVEVALPDTAPAIITFYDVAPGLPPAGAALLQARPPTAVPAGDGDVSMVVVRGAF